MTSTLSPPDGIQAGLRAIPGLRADLVGSPHGDGDPVTTVIALPWAAQAYERLGVTPQTYPYTGVELERIAAARPDLIVGPVNGIREGRTGRRRRHHPRRPDGGHDHDAR